MNKNEILKEKISLKKEFITETLAFENKIFFSALAFVAALALFLFKNPQYYNGWYVLIITLLFYFMETAVQNFRVKKFNELMYEIDTGKISPIQMRPITYSSIKFQPPLVNKVVQAQPQQPNENETVRLSIVALLIAIMFGILQVFPSGQTFDTVGVGSFLKTTASTSLYFPFILFSCYLVLLGHNHRYKKKYTFLKLQAFFYDFGIMLTILIESFATLLSLLIFLLVKYQSFPMGIIVTLIWAFIVVGGLLIFFSIRDHLPALNK